ncbi:MAG: gamma-glutamylcyclotransferase, partial [Bdellovibrionales bacterium]|nr:gamma-glutamylcyclotransferase [Bdellovibrionales bacterium]
MNNLFTYGSLVVPDVMKVVTQKSFEYASAQLHGYSRYTFKDHAYPGIIHTGKGITGGVVYFDLDDESIARLDYF